MSQVNKNPPRSKNDAKPYTLKGLREFLPVPHIDLFSSANVPLRNQKALDIEVYRSRVWLIPTLARHIAILGVVVA